MEIWLFPVICLQKQKEEEEKKSFAFLKMILFS